MIKFIKSMIASYYWLKASKHSHSGFDDEALNYLDKSKKIIPDQSFRVHLLRGLISYRRNNYFDCVECMNHAIRKIKKSKNLNEDERKYLEMHALDLMNFSIVNGRLDLEVIPIEFSFNISNVREIYRREFKVLSRPVQ